MTVNTTTGTTMSCSSGAWVKTGGGYGVDSVAALPQTCDPSQSPNIVFLAAHPYGVYGCFAVNNWVAVGPQVISADNFNSLQAAVAAGGADSEIVLPPGYVTTLNSILFIGQQNVTLRCLPGSMIIKGFNGEAILMSGRNLVMDSCTLDGANMSYSGEGLIISAANGTVVRNSTIQSTAGTAIDISWASGVSVVCNTIKGNLGSGIFAQDFIDGLEIGNNLVDTSSVVNPDGIDTIAVHTFGAGATAMNVNIHDNTILHKGNDYAIEVGSFGQSSMPPVGVLVNNNTMTLEIPSAGGISLSTCSGGQVNTNTIDAAGNMINIDAIELVVVNNITASGNTIKNTVPGSLYTVSINGSSNNSFTNNTIEGGIYVGTTLMSALNVNQNTIQGNAITVPSSADLSKGIVWFQCNAPGCSVSNNTITNNVMTGNNTGPGINFENDYGNQGGVVDSNNAAGNQITGAILNISIGPGVTRVNE